MKKRIQIVLGIFFVMFFGVNSCLAAAQGQNTDDMAEELSNKTFFIVEIARGKARQKDYHAYFIKGGTLAIKFNPKHSKSGKWEVEKKGNLCITTDSNKKGESISQTRCGKLVRSSRSAYRWYDDKGRLRAHFSLTGQGNRLP